MDGCPSGAGALGRLRPRSALQDKAALSGICGEWDLGPGAEAGADGRGESSGGTVASLPAGLVDGVGWTRGCNDGSGNA